MHIAVQSGVSAPKRLLLIEVNVTTRTCWRYNQRLNIGVSLSVITLGQAIETINGRKYGEAYSNNIVICYVFTYTYISKSMCIHMEKTHECKSNHILKSH